MEEIIRKLKELDARLDQLEALSRLTYVKSSWTPTYTGVSTAGTTTYTTQVGYSTRVGRIMFIVGRVVWTAANGTGSAQISIPSTAAALGNDNYVIGIRSSGLTFANNNVVGRVGSGGTSFVMESLLTNAAPTAVAVEAAGDVIFTGFYYLP